MKKQIAILTSLICLSILAGCGTTGNTGAIKSTPTSTSTTPTTSPFHYSGKFVTTGDMKVGRNDPMTVLLPNGKVLIAGGLDNNGNAVSSIEIYDPSLGTFGTGGELTTPRYKGTAVLLQNGKVLFIGGSQNSDGSVSKSAEIYDPRSGQSTKISNTAQGRMGAAGVLLPNGRVLIVGGDSNGPVSKDTAEIFDPSNNSFTQQGALNTSLLTQNVFLTSTGKVIVIGQAIKGDAENGIDIEVYDPTSGKFTNSKVKPKDTYLYSANLLSNGKILITGDINSSGALPAAKNDLQSDNEIYDPVQDTLTKTGNLLDQYMSSYSTVTLSDGTVLFVGGAQQEDNFQEQVFTSSEIYSPSTGNFSYTGSMHTPRANAMIILLNDSRVLILGGTSNLQSDTPSFLTSAEMYE